MHDGYGHVRYMALMGIVKCLWATCYQCSAQGGAYDIHIANSWKPVTPSGDLSPTLLLLVGELHLNVTGVPDQIEDKYSKVMDKSRSQPQGPAGV